MTLVVLVMLSLVSGLAFLRYGYETLFKEPPRGEFERYGMPGVRRLVGSTQMLGGTGVLLGLAVRPLGVAAAVGLSVMMLLGLIVRFKIRDAPRLMVPAASLLIVNVVLAALFAATG